MKIPKIILLICVGLTLIPTLQGRGGGGRGGGGRGGHGGGHAWHGGGRGYHGGGRGWGHGGYWGGRGWGGYGWGLGTGLGIGLSTAPYWGNYGYRYYPSTTYVDYPSTTYVDYPSTTYIDYDDDYDDYDAVPLSVGKSPAQSSDYWTVSNKTPLTITVQSDHEDRIIRPHQTKGLDRERNFGIHVVTAEGKEFDFKDIKDHHIELIQTAAGDIELQTW